MIPISDKLAAAPCMTYDRRSSSIDGHYKQLSILNFIQPGSSNISDNPIAKKIFCPKEILSIPSRDESDELFDRDMHASNTIVIKCKKITSYYMKYNTGKSSIRSTSNSHITDEEPDPEIHNPVSASSEIFNIQEIKSLLNDLIQKTIETVSDGIPMRRIPDLTNKKNIKKPHVPVQLVSPRKSTLPLIHKNVGYPDEISPPYNSTRLGIEAKK